MGHLQSQRRQSSSSTYSLGCRRRIAVRILKNMRWSTCCPSNDVSWLPRSAFSPVVRGLLLGSHKIIGIGQKLNNVAACMHIFWFGLKESHGHKIGSHYRPYQHHDKAQQQSKGASQRSHGILFVFLVPVTLFEHSRFNFLLCEKSSFGTVKKCN